MFLFCYALIRFHSSFCDHFEEKSGFFAFIVLPMYCCCKYSVDLLHEAVGWHALCDCDIS